MFQPVVPFEGLGGWRFLQKTYDRQIESFAKSPQIQRDADYFRENIGKVSSAAELVADRRLLTVALGAFGLQDDINNKFFIQKVLEEGTSNRDAFANRLTDTRYKNLSVAFGFGPGEFRFNTISTFPNRIIEDFERLGFEVAVGNQSESMRIALNAQRSFEDMSADAASETTNWFNVLSQPPLRALFETAFQLPQSFSQIDIDKQREILAERTERAFGTSNPADFNDPELQDQLLSRYTALSQLNSNSSISSAGSVALAILQA